MEFNNGELVNVRRHFEIGLSGPYGLPIEGIMVVKGRDVQAQKYHLLSTIENKHYLVDSEYVEKHEVKELRSRKSRNNSSPVTVMASPSNCMQSYQSPHITSPSLSEISMYASYEEEESNNFVYIEVFYKWCNQYRTYNVKTSWKSKQLFVFLVETERLNTKEFTYSLYDGTPLGSEEINFILDRHPQPSAKRYQSEFF
mmetsp:Transcript_10070/g.10171  ORF Transcript_10070/g.10171 Transcript_10070/m.10171 type:complete len:199 (-) Transcript_10070:189-785(-)